MQCYQTYIRNTNGDYPDVCCDKQVTKGMLVRMGDAVYQVYDTHRSILFMEQLQIPELILAGREQNGCKETDDN